MACDTRKIGGIPAQRGESTDVKKPNREGLGFEYGGGTRNRTRVRFRNQIVTHGSFGRGFDDLAELVTEAKRL